MVKEKILISLGMLICLGTAFLSSKDLFYTVFFGIGGLIMIGAMFKNPYLGIVFMICSIPLERYVKLPGIFRSFTSITSMFGLAAILFYMIKSHNLKAQSRYYDNFIIMAAVLLLIEIIILDIFKPISTGFHFPFNYLQLIILLWLIPQLFTTRHKIEVLMISFICVNLIALFFSMLNFELFSIWGNVNRLSGFLGSANEFGIFLSIAVLMSSHYVITSHKRIFRTIFTFTAIVLTVGIYLSGSRGAIFFLVPAAVFQIWRIRGLKNIFFLFSIICFVLFVFILETYFPAEYIQRIADAPQEIISGSGTLGLRYELWEKALQLWIEKPFFGIGMGMFNYHTVNLPITGERMLSAHNLYISYLTENGIIGLILFSILIFRSMINFEYTIRISDDILDKLSKLVITWEAIFLCILLNGIKIEWGNHKFLWFCFALSMSFVYITQEKSNTEILSESVEQNLIPGRSFGD